MTSRVMCQTSYYTWFIYSLEGKTLTYTAPRFVRPKVELLEFSGDLLNELDSLLEAVQRDKLRVGVNKGDATGDIGDLE
jgi:hypothetical protein